MITVYVTPSCAQCMLTKEVLDAKGVEYRVVDVTASENALLRAGRPRLQPSPGGCRV